MKVHKQIVLIEIFDSYLEVISFYDTASKTFGVDIFDKESLTETIGPMQNEPGHDNMLSLGYNYMKRNYRAAS